MIDYSVYRLSKDGQKIQRKPSGLCRITIDKTKYRLTLSPLNDTSDFFTSAVTKKPEDFYTIALEDANEILYLRSLEEEEDPEDDEE